MHYAAVLIVFVASSTRISTDCDAPSFPVLLYEVMEEAGMAFLLAALLTMIILSVRAWLRRRPPAARTKAAGPVVAQQLLTSREQMMYFRLAEVLSDHIIFGQVAFSAFLSARDTPTRNTFDRKRADFVVCSKAFEILAIIELDDSSHKGREVADAKRDALATAAGYRVLRYKRMPEPEQLRADFGLA
jgi:hypothetical protein